MVTVPKATWTSILLLLLAVPASGTAQDSDRCGIEARGGLGFPTHEEVDERGPSIGAGYSCDLGQRFGIGGDLEVEVLENVGQFRVLGTGRMVLIGEQGGGALVLRGHAGVATSFETGDMLVAPLPQDFTGTTFNWGATGPTAGGGLRVRADLGDGWLGFVEGGIRTALLAVQERWEAGDRVETESILVTTFPVTAGLGVRF